MKSKLDAVIALSGHQVVLATNETTGLSRNLFYNRYGTQVSSQYAEALRDIGATVFICTLDETLARLVDTKRDDQPSFVVNICAAFKRLESEGLIPAIAALTQIPCFPCRGDVAIIAEEKIVSKHLAAKAGFPITNTIRNFSGLTVDETVVRKPINGGDSKGIQIIRKGEAVPDLQCHEFAEPFIFGPDVELFCVWDEESQSHIVLNSLCNDLGTESDAFQIHSAKMKSSSDEYDPNMKEAVNWRSLTISSEIADAVVQLGELFHRTFVFRIDAKLVGEVPLKRNLKLSDIVFLELNVMPTIPGDSGWLSPKLIAMANLDENLLMQWKHLSKGQIALRLLILIWSRNYVQSKSVDGKIPVRMT